MPIGLPDAVPFGLLGEKQNPLGETRDVRRAIAPMTPAISVLLPVWNARRTLRDAIRSIQRQRERDWECLLVDDGSDDGSLAIARAEAERDPRLRVLARPRSGLIAALNAGAARCRGSLVARMDADDLMHRDRLAAQRATLERHPRLEAVGCRVRLFPRSQLRDGRRRYEAWLNGLNDAAAIFRDRFIECPVAHPSMMIRREALLALGYRERGWPEDYDLVLRLLRQGPCVGTTDAPSAHAPGGRVKEARLLSWRDRSDRLSRTSARYDLDRFTACRAWHLSRDFLGARRAYVLWGHGRTGRALRRALAALGHEPAAIVEVHPRRLGQRIHGAQVIAPEDLRAGTTHPLVASVAGAGPRGEIRAVLDGMGFVETRDYLCAA